MNGKITKNEAMYMTGHKFEQESFDKAILSVGSCENHGSHLPFGTDTLISYKLSVKVAEKCKNLLVLPPVTVGFSEHYAKFPFTMSIKSETLIEVLKDLLESVIKNGITKIFIMNGHDGNIAPIEIASRAIKVAYPNVKIASLDAWWLAIGNIFPKDYFDAWNGAGHAGEGESALSLALHEELCDMEYARGVIPDNLPSNIDIKWDFAEITDCGAGGDPTKATVEKGKKIEETLVELVSNFINDMDKKDWNYNSTLSKM